MAARVVLTLIQGPPEGREFVFTERTWCTVGRAACCDLRMPVSDCTVSRHHCLLAIDPPEIHVRDCGSRNGTFVNGHRIPAPAEGANIAADAPQSTLGWPLVSGDELRVGQCVFRVRVEPADKPAGKHGDSEIRELAACI